MTIVVQLFGPQAQLVGQREVSVALSALEPTCADVRAALAEAAPILASSLSESRFAVNQEFADDTQPVHPQDEVALIGMVSGG